MLLVTGVLLVLLGLVLSQAPSPCPGPTKWQGRFQRYDRERSFMVRGYMIYDGDNKRIREMEDETFNQTQISYLKLKLYNENKEYRVDLKTRKCNVTAPRHPFHPYGVPSDGQYEAEAVIGAVGIPGEYVTAAAFEAKLNTTDATLAVTVSVPHCFPLDDHYFGSDGLDVTKFYDMREGIDDPKAFDIPTECQSLAQIGSL